MSSLPLHQSLRVYKQNQRLIILSVAEAGLRIGRETPYPTFATTDFIHGAHLFAQKITLNSDIRAPCGLTLSTWKLSVPNGTVRLDATGVEGKDDGTADTRNGGPGGSLGVYVQDLDDAAAFAFSRWAQGGHGGDTYSSTGVVGNGGKGGSIVTVLQPTYVSVLDFAQKYRLRTEFHPEDRGRYQIPVTREDPLYHGGIAVLDLTKKLPASPDTIANIFSELSTILSKIAEGVEVRTVLDVKLALVKGITKLENLIQLQYLQLVPKFDNVRGGYGGRGVNVDVPGGKQGADGLEEQTFIRLNAHLSTHLAKASLPFAHPEQCAMLLERADIFFYINSPLMRSHAQRLYQRLVNLLCFLPLQPTDPLYIAYQQSPIMPSSSLLDLERIRASAASRLVVLISGKVDYNGYAPRWVPRASYKFYKRVLDDALANLRLFEDAYTKYHAALTRQEDLNDKVKLAYNNTSRMVSTLQQDQTDLRLTLQDLDRKIAGLTPVVRKAREDLKYAYEAVLNQIRLSFGLHVSQIINAFTSIAFSPAGIASTVDVIYQGFVTVPTIDGQSVTREYLASEIRKSEATIKNIALVLKRKIDGTYQLDDPFSTRLVVAKEQMLAELEKFSKEAFGGVSVEATRKDLETKFDAFIDAVTKRNDVILQYNVTVKLLLEKIEKANLYEAKQQELVVRQVRHNDPDLPAITAYIGSIYQSSRARVMKLLNILVRSLNFRMLHSYDVVDYIFPGSNHGEATIDDVPLTLTAAVLASARSNIEELFWGSLEHWGSEPVRFPNNFDTDPGKRYYLNASQRSELLTSADHTVFLSIPVDAGNDFDRCCNVRIYRARFGFNGLKTVVDLHPDESAFVKVTLIHGGSETFVDRSHKEVFFDHDPLSTLYSFRLKPDGSSTVVDNGNIAQADVNAVATSYAAPGPFAAWTISMKGTEWSKLDIEGVREAYFDFCGTNYAYLEP